MLRRTAPYIVTQQWGLLHLPCLQPPRLQLADQTLSVADRHCPCLASELWLNVISQTTFITACGEG